MASARAQVHVTVITGSTTWQIVALDRLADLQIEREEHRRTKEERDELLRILCRIHAQQPSAVSVAIGPNAPIRRYL